MFTSSPSLRTFLLAALMLTATQQSVQATIGDIGRIGLFNAAALAAGFAVQTALSKFKTTYKPKVESLSPNMKAAGSVGLFLLGLGVPFGASKLIRCFGSDSRWLSGGILSGFAEFGMLIASRVWEDQATQAALIAKPL